MSSAADPRPRVALLALGGTIAMTHDDSGAGVIPSLDGPTLAAAVPQLSAVAEVEATTLSARPSASLSFGDVLAAARAAHEAVRSGASGVVISQGTDTLEETAYLLDLIWDRREPLVVTGAMRNPTQAGADGPANLLAAVTAAASPKCAGLGVLVVLNDEIHAARYVQKRRSTSLNAFDSPDTGPVGRIAENQVRLLTLPSPQRMPVLTAPSRMDDTRVAVVPATLNDDGGLITLCARAGYDAVVVAALGAGHLSEKAAARAIEAASVKPVVLATRTGSGGILTNTYGFDGSETHLLRGGLISAGLLHPLKARILLSLLLASESDRATIAARFQVFGHEGLSAPPAQASAHDGSRGNGHGTLRQQNPRRPLGEEPA
jgi:L-asparaginase